MKILVFVLCMYLAAVLLNTIQLCRTYYSLTKTLPPYILFGSFILMLIRPRFVILGLLRAFQDWNWMNDRFYADNEGYIHVREEEKENA